MTMKYARLDLGTIEAIVNKLGGLEGVERFLRGELMVESAKPDQFLKLLSGGENLTIDALNGEDILAEARDVFAWIDNDFRNWGADEPGEATEEAAVEVHELIKDGMFSQFFSSACNDLDKLCFMQAQIKNFCVKHRSWLRTDGYATFFLFKSKGKYFVARVGFDVGGQLKVYVPQFDNRYVWNAGFQHRVVLPQLAA
jgi:hypothetical protein